MNTVINNLLVSLNNIGQVFWDYSARAFIQSSVFIILLLIIDFILRRRVRAVFRYCIWMLVFVKLILPPSFSLPTGIGYWWSGFEKRPALHSLNEGRWTRDDGRETMDEGRVTRDETVSAVTSQVEPSEVIPEPDAPSVPVSSSLTSLSWQAVVFVLWLIGILVFSVLLIQRAFFVRGLIAQSSPAESRLCELLRQCRQQLGLRRDIQIRLSTTLLSPAVCGLFRPIILMPTSLSEKLSQDKLKAILIHELAHIKRGDLWVNLVQTILQVVYFYNPFVWLTNAVVRRIREQAVDEMVLVALGTEAKSYSNTLIDIAETAFWKANFSLRLIGVAESKKALEGRIKYMLTHPIPKSAKIGFFGLLTVIVIAAVLLPMAAAEDRGQKTDDRVEKQFAATLPKDVIVELVGLCEYPSEGKKWWKPDGTELSQEIRVSHRGRVSASGKPYAVAVKATMPEDATFKWGDIKGAGSVGDLEAVDSKGQPVSNMHAFMVYIDEKLTSTSVQLRVASGPWQTRARNRGNYLTSTAGIVFSVAYESDGGVTLTVSDEHLDLDHRIIAIDTDGKEHVPEKKPWGSAGNVRQTTAHFDNLKLDQIKEFQFQTRPFQWVTFKNVSLQPGGKTDVKVQVGSDEKIDYSSVVVKEGVGFGEIIVGDFNCTGEFIKSKLGQPDTEVKDEKTGWWLNYKKTYGLDFWLNLKENVLLEIRLNSGFKGKLVSGISMSSAREDVFNIYGKPIREETISDLKKHFDNQVLYKKQQNSKIFYNQRGLLFWFEGDKILQIVIHRKNTKPDMQVEIEGQPDASQVPAAGAGIGQTKPELLKQIETVTDVLIKAFNAGDIDTILSYYTDDGMSLPDQHEAAIGKGALHKLHLEAKEEGVKIYSIKGLEQQIWDCGDLIFEAGRCMASLKSPKLRFLLSDWRKYVTVWARQPDGSLKIKLDSWNPDVIPAANVASEPAGPVVTMVGGGTSTDSNMEAIYAQIKQKELTFHKAFIDHDAEAAVQFYADDAIIMSWGKDAVRGKANISSDIRKSMSDEPLVDMTQHVVHIEGNDQMLFAVNLFSWTFKDKSSGENVTLPGKGVHVWKRQQDGSWKILLDLYNPNVPMQQ